MVQRDQPLKYHGGTKLTMCCMSGSATLPRENTTGRHHGIETPKKSVLTPSRFKHEEAYDVEMQELIPIFG